MATAAVTYQYGLWPCLSPDTEGGRLRYPFKRGFLFQNPTEFKFNNPATPYVAYVR
jgi:hypothetical protein